MTSSTPNQNHWLDIAETSSVVGSIGGSIASIFLKQFLWVTVPLTVTAGLAVVNHQRLKGQIASKQAALSALIEENQTKVSQLKQQSEKQHWDNKVELAELKKAGDTSNIEIARMDQEQKKYSNRANQELQTLQASLGKLDQLTQQLQQEQNESSKIAQELKAIDRFSLMIKGNANSPEAYYQRGCSYQATSNIGQAIDDFTQAIALCNDYAQAYHQRGLLYSEIGELKKANIDLRRASQYYIAKGDLDKYRETRDLSLEIHFNQSAEANGSEPAQKSAPEQQLESVAVGSLFE